MTEPSTAVYKIREAGREDAATVLGLIQGAFQTVYDRLGLTPAGWPYHAANLKPEAILRNMDEGWRYWVLESPAGPCGCVGLDVPEPGTVKVRRLAVLPSHRHRGLGRRLVDHVLSEARRMGARRAILAMFGDDPDLQHWYERMGFRVTETKAHDGVPVLITHMALDLGAGVASGGGNPGK